MDSRIDVIRMWVWYFLLPRGIIDFMSTLTIKISPDLEQALLQTSEQAHLSKSEVVRRAIVAYINQRKTVAPFVSALDQAGDLVGCFSGAPADLSSNPRYLDGFGKV